MTLDDRIRQVSETILQEVRSPIESALQRVLGDVTKLAGDDRDEAVQSALAAATAGHEAALAGLREELTRAHEADTTRLRQQLEQDHEKAMADLRADLERDHEAALARLRDELAGDRETAMRSARDEAAASHQTQLQEHEARWTADREAAIQAVREELGRSHEHSLSAARAAAELAGGAALAVAVAHAEQQQHQAEAEKQQAETARQDAESRLAAVNQELEQARAESVQARQAAHDADSQRQAAEQSLDVTHAADREQEMACTDRMLTTFRHLDDSRSLSEILRLLADQAAFETGRVAVLIVAGSRLRVWALRGFPDTNRAPGDMPIQPGTIFGLAVTRGLPVSTSEAPIGSDGDPLSDLLAVPAGRAGLAVPLLVGGQTVAILYADDAGDRTPVVPSCWPELAEILARHAGHCLELLTISHVSALAGSVQNEPEVSAVRPSDASPFVDRQREEESARRYARLLISEVKLYNEAAVEQGRAERNLLERLGPDLERARRLYEEKIPESVGRRVDIFDEEVVRTLAGGDSDLLGHT